MGSAPGGAGIGWVSLPQCANVAMGACQQSANGWAVCGGELANGYGNCAANTFQAYFNDAAKNACGQYAQAVTGVVPGTNQWAPVQPQPYIVIGSAGPGGAIGGAAPGGMGSKAPVAAGGGVGMGATAPATSAPSKGNRRLMMV